MVVSFAVACFVQWGAKPIGLETWLTSGWCAEWFDLTAWKLLIGVAVTTICWLGVTFMTPREPDRKLAEFSAKVAGPRGELAKGVVCAAFGCVAVWSCLFGTGWLLYGYGGKAEFVCRGWIAQGIAAVAVVALLMVVGSSTRSTCSTRLKTHSSTRSTCSAWLKTHPSTRSTCSTRLNQKQGRQEDEKA